LIFPSVHPVLDKMSRDMRLGRNQMDQLCLSICGSTSKLVNILAQAPISTAMEDILREQRELSKEAKEEVEARAKNKRQVR
jgi:hypothetical protein